MAQAIQRQAAVSDGSSTKTLMQLYHGPSLLQPRPFPPCDLPPSTWAYAGLAVGCKMLSFVALGSFAVAIFGRVDAQTTTAQCEQGFEWVSNHGSSILSGYSQRHAQMFNSKGQTPCLVAAYLFSACEPNPSGGSRWSSIDEGDTLMYGPSDAFIQALVPNDGDYYSIPQTAVSPCFCNTVFYSVIGACSYCQGDVNLPYVMDSLP